MHNYFSHDSNARNDEKLVRLRMRHGAAGYGVYFMILERLRDEKKYMCAKDYNMIAFDLRVDAALVKSVVEDYGLFAFTDDGKCFYSESFLNRMSKKEELSRKRAEAGLKGSEAKRKKDNANTDKEDCTNHPQPSKSSKLTFLEFSKWLQKKAPELLALKAPDEDQWTNLKCIYITRKRLEKACLEIAANEPFRRKWSYFAIALTKWHEHDKMMHPEIVQQEAREREKLERERKIAERKENAVPCPLNN